MRAAVQIWTSRAELKKPDLLLAFCLLFGESEHWSKTEAILLKCSLSTVIWLLHLEGYKHCDVATTNFCQPVPSANSQHLLA